MFHQTVSILCSRKAEGMNEFTCFTQRSTVWTQLCDLAPKTSPSAACPFVLTKTTLLGEGEGEVMHPHLTPSFPCTLLLSDDRDLRTVTHISAAKFLLRHFLTLSENIHFRCRWDLTQINAVSSLWKQHFPPDTAQPKFSFQTPTRAALVTLLHTRRGAQIDIVDFIISDSQQKKRAQVLEWVKQGSLKHLFGEFATKSCTKKNAPIRSAVRLSVCLYACENTKTPERILISYNGQFCLNLSTYSTFVWSLTKIKVT